jgi:tRNA(Ile)-lysidine synthase
LAALAELADRRELGRVALGHNADDQSETVLFRVLRGTGRRGLAGIPYRRGPFIRPLLDVTRAEILAYLHRRSLPYAVDPSNSDLRYTRARLRHRVLPLLRQENPRVDVALRALAAEFQTDDPSAAETGVDAIFDNVHVPTRVAAQIEAAVRAGQGTRRFDLPSGRRVEVAYGEVTMGRVDARAEAANRAPVDPVALPGPGCYRFGGGRRIQIVDDQGDWHTEADPSSLSPSSWSWFDADLLSWPLVARPRRPGDRMTPRGGVGGRKLSDLMIDAKIPRRERAELPVITAADGELLFVPGLRPSRRGCPGPATMRRIGLAVLPKPDHDDDIDGQVDRSIRRGNTGWYRCQDRHPPAPAGQAESEENRSRSPELQ